MQQKCTSRRNPNPKSNESLHETPLRRSPRLNLLPIDANITEQAHANKNQACPSPPRLSHPVGDSGRVDALDITQKGGSRKPSRRSFRLTSPRKPARTSVRGDFSFQTLRRSPRFSYSAGDSSEVIGGLDMTSKGEESTRAGGRSVILMSSVKDSDKSDLVCSGLDEFGRSKQREKKKGTPALTLTACEGGEIKRRKIERRDKEEKGQRRNVVVVESNTLEEPKTDSQVRLMLMGGREKESTTVVGRDKEEVCMERRVVEGGSLGWTSTQEVALNRAYLVAKPSPRFWKKVSKMVPGKSAQDCFDRVHCSLVTPPQPQPRSRKNRSSLSPVGRFSLSGSKLGELFKPTGKRLKSGKQKKGLIAQKTVRHILRKQFVIDKNEEADLFSVLETSTTGICTQDFSHIQMTSTLDDEKPSSTYESRVLSRMKATNKENQGSPEVLKRVKNMVLHEKYIDKLHLREARRRIHRKTANYVVTGDDMLNAVPKRRVVKTAKNALILLARDAIGQVQRMQSTCISNDADFSDNSDGDSEDA